MSTITRERVEEFISNPASLVSAEESEILELARIALASLEAEPAGIVRYTELRGPEHPAGIHVSLYSRLDDGIELYTAPPAPVENTGLQRKAAIHDALCKKYSVESLADFVDWQRNHIAELEAAPPALVGPGDAAVMPDYPGYVLTQRECYQAGKKAGLAEAGNSPVIPDALIAAVNRLLDSDGSRGCYSAIRCHAAREEVERFLAAAPQQEVKP